MTRVAEPAFPILKAVAPRVAGAIRRRLYSVNGTGSVVAKSSDQPGVILAGNFARGVREGITWTRAKFGTLPAEVRG